MYLTGTVIPKGVITVFVIIEFLSSESSTMLLIALRRPGGLPTFLMFIWLHSIFLTLIACVLGEFCGGKFTDE
jgi:hypothetical protein